MKVRVHFTGSSMSIFIVSGAGITRIGDQNLHSSSASPRKIDMFKKVFSDNEEYNIEPFFLALTKIRNIRLLGFLNDKWMNNTIAQLRETLERKEVKREGF